MAKTIKIENGLIEELALFAGESLEASQKILEKAVLGGESAESDLREWYEHRFKPNVVFVEQKEYGAATIDALRIITHTAGTDFGGSRQRDLAQRWADFTRGYLGEQAFKQFLATKFNIDSELEHTLGGEIGELSATDIKRIKKPEEEWRNPLLKISIKTSKMGGIWLDVAKAQLEATDVAVLVRIGGSTQSHLLAFMKSLSVFKDKILKFGQDQSIIDADEAQRIFDDVPSFNRIPAYICGFVKTSDVVGRPARHEGILRTKNYEAYGWSGLWTPAAMAEIKQKENVPGSVSLRGLGEISHDAYLFNAGALQWQLADWEGIARGL